MFFCGVFQIVPDADGNAMKNIRESEQFRGKETAQFNTIGF